MFRASRKSVYRVSPRRSSCAHMEELEQVDTRCTTVMYVSLSSWLVLTALLLAGQALEPCRGAYTYLHPFERLAAASSALIGVCLVTFDTLLRRVMASLDEAMGSVGHQRKKTGVRKLCDSVQLMAMLTDVIMAALPVPVVVDPFLETRVHLVRWLEWTIAGYMMTYMIEIVDTARGEGAHFLALTQAGSTACALFFPFMPNIYCYVLLMALSFALYFVLFPRLRTKRRAAAAAVRKMAQLCETDKASIVGVIASINMRSDAKRIIQASALLTVCVVVWSVFVFVFFMEPLARFVFPGEKKDEDEPVWPFVVNSILHVVVKLFFGGFIVATEESLFSTESRSQQVDDEVCKFVGAGLQSVSGCAGFVYEHGDRVVTALSPLLLRMVHDDTTNATAPGDEKTLRGASWDDARLLVMTKLMNDWGSSHSRLVTRLCWLADAVAVDDDDDDDRTGALQAAPLCCEHQRVDDELQLRRVSPDSLSHVIESEHVSSLIRRCVRADATKGIRKKPAVIPCAVNSSSDPVVVLVVPIDSTHKLLVLKDFV